MPLKGEVFLIAIDIELIAMKPLKIKARLWLNNNC